VGYLNFPDIINNLVKMKKGENIRRFKLEGYWMDIGRPEDYPECLKNLRG
jgi:NDP-sugar pyrophosphorylase family protein